MIRKNSAGPNVNIELGNVYYSVNPFQFGFSLVNTQLSSADKLLLNL